MLHLRYNGYVRSMAQTQCHHQPLHKDRRGKKLQMLDLEPRLLSRLSLGIHVYKNPPRQDALLPHLLPGVSLQKQCLPPRRKHRMPKD